jgi:hypothetical protein
MTAVSLLNLESQLDGITDDRFLFVASGIAGLTDTTDLTFAVDSITLPGNRAAVQEIKMFGFTRKWRGGQTPGDGRVQMTLYENVTMSIYKKLLVWNANAVDPSSGNSDPNWLTTADLYVYDTTGALATTITFYNIWCEEVQAITLSGQSSKAMQITTTLCFDYFDVDNSFWYNAMNGNIGSGLRLAVNDNGITLSQAA